MKRLIAFSLFFFSLFAIAEESTMVMINAGRNAGSLDVEASFTRLSPQAVEMGLRDVILIGRLKDKNNADGQEHDVQWHSISKNIDGTTKAKSLDSPLYSEKPLDDKGQEKNFDVGSQVLAKGDLNAMLAKFAEMLAESEKTTEENTEIKMEEAAASQSPLSTGSMASSPTSQKANLKEDGFSVKTDKFTMSYELCEPSIDSAFIATEMERSIKTSTVTSEILEKSECTPTGKKYKTFKESTELCKPLVDSNFVATELSKVVKRNEKTGEVLEESACKPTGRTFKSFKASTELCAPSIDSNFVATELSKVVKRDEKTNEVLSESACKPTGKTYKTFKESTEKCEPSIDLNFVATERSKVIKKDLKTGEVLEEGACESTGKTYDTFKEIVRACEVFIDRDNNKVIEMKQTVKLDLKTDEELAATACDFTDKSYPIERDFKVKECVDLPNYIDSEYYKGYKEFYDLKGLGNEKDIVYISRCSTTTDAPTPIFQDVSTCKPTENLTTNTATINKKWYYLGKLTGLKEYVSECLESKETYPITETTTTCSPVYDGKKVFTTTRKHWRDARNSPHYVTDCRVSENSGGVRIQKEYSGALSHDWAGGISYEMSRDYYVDKGRKIYLKSAYSRDPSQSYGHKRTTSGCAPTHNDAGRHSVLNNRVYINRKGRTEYLTGCQASSSKVQYVFTRTADVPFNAFGGANTKAIVRYYRGSTAQFCSEAKSTFGFNYNVVTGNVTNKEVHCTSSGSEGTVRNCSYEATIRSEKRTSYFTRVDGTVFTTTDAIVCRGLSS